MTKSEFLLKLQDILQREAPVMESDCLADYSEWDSLSKMALLAYYSQAFGISITLNDFKKLLTVADLIQVPGERLK
jgi:acyl carrier protein